MMFDEPLPNSSRPYISSSLSAPAFPSFSSNGSPNPNPRFSTSPSSSYKNPRSSSASLPSSSSSAVGFSYNYRIAVALIPAAAFLLDLGGAPVAATLTLSLMIAYILDSLHLKSASFFAVWFALIASQIAFFFSSSPLSLFPSVPLSLAALLLCGETNFLVGVWASLQFRYILIENSAIVPALERLLFACVPIAVPPLFTWASVSATGLGPATAYHLAAFCAVSYWLFSLPRPSSFRSKKELARGRDAAGEESYILGPLESCLHTLNLLFLPVAFHVASHHSTIFSSASSVSDLLLLFFLPFLFLLYASLRGALWWVTRDGQQVHQIRVVNGAVALVVVVICLEIRVVFHAFGKYLHVPPPLNYLLVTIAMLGGASGVAAYALGMVNDAVSSVAFTALSILVSGAGAVVVGFPVYLLPLPLISGFYLARFFTRKSPASYFAFVMLASLMVVWFVMHNFWDLNIWLAGMALKSSCKLIVASAILAMAIPGLILLPRSLRFATELGLITYAFLLCYIENRLFNYTGIYFFGFEDEVVYPSYMIIVTTLLGLSLVRRLVVDQRIGPKAAWVATCLYSSKLAMLLITAKSVLWASAALLLAVSPPLLLYKDKSKVTSRMKPWQGFAHAGVIAFSAWLCRETIFEALQWWNGRPPSDGLLLGFYILSTGVACIPIVALHFSHVQVSLLFQPPLYSPAKQKLEMGAKRKITVV